MSVDKYTKSKKAYLVSLKDKLKKHLQLQSISANQVDRRWLNGFMAAGFHSGLMSLSELKLEYSKADPHAYHSPGGPNHSGSNEESSVSRHSSKRFR